jgi:hypothetical protein
MSSSISIHPNIMNIITNPTFHIVLLSIIFISVLCACLSSFNINVFAIINKGIYKLFKHTIAIDKILYLIAFICVCILAINRDIWLPFLGKSVIPTGIFANSVPANADQTVYIKTEPNAQILYWAAYPNSKTKQPREAYDDYKNTGFTSADNDGNAQLLIIDNDGYTINNKPIDKHVHYRIVNKGMVGSIQTAFY